jgi:uncharacterized protein YegJ (DUF2314 family)
MKTGMILLMLILSSHVFAEGKIDDQVRNVSEQDAAMNAAILKARNTLHEFFLVANNPPEGASGFKLKAMMSDDSGAEHLWFSPFKEIDGGFAGLLVNEPSVIKSMTYGEVYAFRESQITDWGYVLNGEQIGSYTVCVLFKSMEKDIVEQYKQDHGFVCDSK